MKEQANVFRTGKQLKRRIMGMQSTEEMIEELDREYEEMERVEQRDGQAEIEGKSKQIDENRKTKININPVVETRIYYQSSESSENNGSIGDSDEEEYESEDSSEMKRGANEKVKEIDVGLQLEKDSFGDLDMFEQSLMTQDKKGKRGKKKDRATGAGESRAGESRAGAGGVGR
ncbi:hypothetical protein AX774_g1305 [Zancudomyces culisetae]|uniref:Uncharacterized protein n=1 Tax=Zancudomyces culisetae TaxID=1213189 RepID=A0A1R1PW70_ZANCU|nr:hypothetical protein AX774_g1305 [Zancudomyces culisetae]|eukprot:OMH85162.1 hypothetical protein AX774_g1305 [Zancudomyces culisetae]